MKRSVKIILGLSLLLNLAIVYVAYKALEYRSHINFFLDKYNNVVEEFSRRSEFAEQNKGLISDTLVPGRVVLFGTQLVAGWKTGDSLGRFTIINRGVETQRVSGLLLRFYQDVIRLSPEYVLIEISSYNLRRQWSLAEIEDNLRSMTELARYHEIKPILTTMVPLAAGADNYEDYLVADSVMKFNDVVRRYADDNGVLLLDLYKIVADDKGNLRADLAAGPIDLNAKGYALISDQLLQLLNK